MIQIIQIDPRQLKAIALLAPKTDQRYWLNGVFVEATSTETRLVAMDGKRMGVFLSAKANRLADAIQVSAILPHGALDFVRPIRGRFAQLELRIDSAVPRFAELSHGGTSFQFLTIDAGYPIYRRALGPHRGSGEAGQYDPRHLNDFHRVLEAMEGKLPPDRNGVYLHHNGNDNTRVSINRREDFVGTVRPQAVDAYNRCIEAVLGSPEAFFTCVFSAQNRRPIASYQAGEIKKLLAELLGIDHLRDLSAKAGEVAKGLGRHLDTLQRDLVGLSAQRERAAQLARDIGLTDEALIGARRDRDAKSADGAKLLQERATLAAKQSASAATEARLRELRQRETEVGARRRQLDADQRVVATRVATRRRELEQLIASRKLMLAEGPAILAAAEQRDALQMIIGQKQGEFATLQQGVSRLEAQQAQHAALATELQGLEARGKSAAQFATSLKGQADVIETVPCRADPMHSTCPLLAQARDAKGKLAEQVILVKDLRASYQAKQQAMKPMADALGELPAQRAALAALQTALARDQQELQRLTALAAKKPMLDVAQEGLAQAQRDVTTLTDEEAASTARYDRDVAEAESQLSVVKRELSGLATEDVTGLIAAVDTHLRQGREAVVALDARIEALIRQQTSLATERERVELVLSGLPAVQGKADRLSDEIAQWKLLAKGLGNDGVIAMSIDDAGPALTRIVNDLLLACYGARFTIAIQTQTTLANGEKREGFEIEVNDADRDSVKNFALLSGGQKIWIDECLTRGIALYRAQDTGQPFQTLFTDEADGPLDPERKRAFMQMKREVLRQGGYEREFFISHTPESVDEADAVIDVVALAA